MVPSTIVQRADFTILTARFIAVLLADKSRGVFFRSLCRALELDHSSQVQRLKRQPVLYAGVRYVVLPTRQGERTTIVLLAWAIPLWLAGLNLSRLSESAQRLTQLMQVEMIDRLYALFQDTPLDRATPELYPDPVDNPLQDTLPEPMPDDISIPGPLAARFSVLEAQVGRLEGRIERIETSLASVETHISQIAAQLNSETLLRINDERLLAAAITRFMLAPSSPTQRPSSQRRRRRSR